MPNLEHAALTGTQLHEPKDVSSAAINTVYLANGAGSGAWASVPGAGINTVTINTLTDFPTPVSGVITLAASTLYLVHGIIDILTNRFVMSANAGIIGNDSSVDKISSSTTGTLFTATSTFNLKSLGIVAPSAKIFDLTGAGSLQEVAFLEGIEVTSCTSLGTITNWGFFILIASAHFSATTTGYSFSGACGNLTVDGGVLVVAAGIGIDLGTATFSQVYIGPSLSLTVAGGATGLSVAVNSGNINSGGRGIILGNVFDGAGTLSVGLSPADLLWQVSGSQGLSDTEIGAQGHIIGSALSTTFSGTGSGNAVLVNFGTAFLEDVASSNQFTISTAGRFTYIGKESRLMFFDATLFATIAGGAARQYVYTLSKNGTQIVSSSSKTEYDGSNPGSNSVSSIVELAENDFIEIKVYAVTATTALNVDTTSIKIRSM